MTGQDAPTLQQFLGIPVALLGAVFMSFGTQFQSRGLNKVEKLTQTSAAASLRLQHVFSLLARPSWLIGTVLLAFAVLLQIFALSLSPLIVVQPLGVAALVITAILNAKMSGFSLSPQVKVAIFLCVAGVMVFVTVAAFTARDMPVSDTKLTLILVLFAVCVTILCFLIFLLRNNPKPLVFIAGAGVLYAFVVTFAKSILSHWQHEGFDPLLWLAVVALIVGAVLGMVYVQNAHSSGPPDLVIAGLTVIDPIVAVGIGVVVLGEAQDAPAWASWVFVVTGAIALFGVYGISKLHPQAGKNILASPPSSNPPVAQTRPQHSEPPAV